VPNEGRTGGHHAGVGALIVGVGCDLVPIGRLAAALDRRPRLAERLFTPAEQAEGEGQAARLAGKFAAKEACLKALGTGLSGCRWTEVEVLRAGGGPPAVRLHGAALRLAAERGVDRLHVSIAHDAGLALAQAVAESSAPPSAPRSLPPSAPRSLPPSAPPGEPSSPPPSAPPSTPPPSEPRRGPAAPPAAAPGGTTP
jgi:holo-[acyl-carrier protein] synthase